MYLILFCQPRILAFYCIALRTALDVVVQAKPSKYTDGTDDVECRDMGTRAVSDAHAYVVPWLEGNEPTAIFLVKCHVESF